MCIYHKDCEWLTVGVTGVGVVCELKALAYCVRVFSIICIIDMWKTCEIVS